MFRTFFPDEYLDSTYEIDFEKLYQDGYRGLIFDIDNTLVRHGEPADERAVALFKRLKKIGFDCFPIISMRGFLLLIKRCRCILLKMHISHRPRIISRQWS